MIMYVFYVYLNRFIYRVTCIYPDRYPLGFSVDKEGGRRFYI